MPGEKGSFISSGFSMWLGVRYALCFFPRYYTLLVICSHKPYSVCFSHAKDPCAYLRIYSFI